MVKRAYVPNCGDVIWLEFNPQAGQEQAGKRPALVLSPRSYNDLVGLAIVCPITSQIKGYPFEVHLHGKKITGVVLSDHVKSADWAQRRATFIEMASSEVVEEVASKLQTLLPKTV
jgi:mRNA interferase MazF